MNIIDYMESNIFFVKDKTGIDCCEFLKFDTDSGGISYLCGKIGRGAMIAGSSGHDIRNHLNTDHTLKHCQKRICLEGRL